MHDARMNVTELNCSGLATEERCFFPWEGATKSYKQKPSFPPTSGHLGSMNFPVGYCTHHGVLRPVQNFDSSKVFVTICYKNV